MCLTQNGRGRDFRRAYWVFFGAEAEEIIPRKTKDAPFVNPKKKKIWDCRFFVGKSLETPSIFEKRAVTLFCKILELNQ